MQAGPPRIPHDNLLPKEKQEHFAPRNPQGLLCLYRRDFREICYRMLHWKADHHCWRECSSFRLGRRARLPTDKVPAPILGGYAVHRRKKKQLLPHWQPDRWPMVKPENTGVRRTPGSIPGTCMVVAGARFMQGNLLDPAMGRCSTSRPRAATKGSENVGLDMLPSVASRGVASSMELPVRAPGLPR